MPPTGPASCLGLGAYLSHRDPQSSRPGDSTDTDDRMPPITVRCRVPTAVGCVFSWGHELGRPGCGKEMTGPSRQPGTLFLIPTGWVILRTQSTDTEYDNGHRVRSMRLYNAAPLGCTTAASVSGWFCVVLDGRETYERECMGASVELLKQHLPFLVCMYIHTQTESLPCLYPDRESLQGACCSPVGPGKSTRLMIQMLPFLHRHVCVFTFLLGHGPSTLQ